MNLKQLDIKANKEKTTMKNRKYANIRPIVYADFFKKLTKTWKKIKKTIGPKVSVRFFQTETKCSQSLRLVLTSRDAQYVFILREKKK